MFFFIVLAPSCCIWASKTSKATRGLVSRADATKAAPSKALAGCILYEIHGTTQATVDNVLLRTDNVKGAFFISKTIFESAITERLAM